MRLWRISDHADLNGDGGRLVSGRWHTQGRPIVYLAEHSALALLESLVHLEIDPEDLPSTYQLLTVEVPDDIATTTLSSAALEAIDPAWPANIAVTRGEGDAWLAAARTALFSVPSVIMPEAVNVLLNPLHPQAGRVRIAAVRQPPYDRRLFGA